MKLLKVVMLDLLFLSSDAAFSSAYQGKITHVFAYSGKVFIALENGAFDGPVSCTTTTDHMMLWIDPVSDYGRALISIALTAKTTGGLTWVGGDNACITGPGGRTSEQLVMMDFKG